MKRIILIFSALVFIVANVGLSQDIINETGKDGKFIVRDTEEQEALVIEDGNVGITGELSVEQLPEGKASNPYVVWDPEDKKFKTVARLFSKVSPLSEPLGTGSSHRIGYGELEEGIDEIQASVQGTAASWNQFDTDFGYIALGPANATWGHIYTDRNNFLFNKPIYAFHGVFGSYPDHHLYLNTSGDTRIFADHSTGNVGIGTTGPVARLHIKATDTHEMIRLEHASTPYISFYQGTDYTGLVQSHNNNFFVFNRRPGDMYFGTNNLYRMTIAANGDVGIGDDTPDYKLDVETNQASGHVAKFENTNTGTDADGIIVEVGPNANPGSGNFFIRFQDGGGTHVGGIRGNGTGGITISYSSDRRLKTNIKDMDDGLALLSKIKVRKYEMRSAPGKDQIGLIAQELQEVYPMVVSGDAEGDVDKEPMGVDYGRLTPILIKAIQELQTLNDGLQARIEILEHR